MLGVKKLSALYCQPAAIKKAIKTCSEECLKANIVYDFSNNESYINQFPNAQYPHDNYLIGAIREEDKRVYFYPYTLSWLSTGGIYGLAPNQDHLLYDFNVAAGDTVTFSSTQWIELINGNPIVFYFENFV